MALRALPAAAVELAPPRLRPAATGPSVLTAHEMTVALGGRWRGRNGAACCPAHRDRDPSLSIADGREGRVLVKCFGGCDQGAVIAALRARGLWPGRVDRDRRPDPKLERQRREADKADRARRVTRARRIWAGALPVIAGDTVDRYLRGRGLEPPAAGWPPSIRSLPVASHPSGARFPALVAAACRWPGSTPSAVQCLALDQATTGKADIVPVRWTHGVLAGAAVRVSPWKSGRRVAITEGVEDALAVALAVPDTAAWAVLGNSAKDLILPSGAKIVLCLDGDPAGRSAARAAAHILGKRGYQVHLARLPDGADPAALAARGSVSIRNIGAL
jgi:hypothetical protein